jgi:hypothetical protein
MMLTTGRLILTRKVRRWLRSIHRRRTTSAAAAKSTKPRSWGLEPLEGRTFLSVAWNHPDPPPADTSAPSAVIVDNQQSDAQTQKVATVALPPTSQANLYESFEFEIAPMPADYTYGSSTYTLEDWIDKFDALDTAINSNHQGYTTSNYIAPGGDASANIAWAQSYLMQGYLDMYQATGDTKYLDYFTDQFDNIESHYYVDDAWQPIESFSYSINPARNGNATMIAPDASTEILNEQFETGSPLPSGWSYWQSGTTAIRDTTDKYAGSSSLQIQVPANGTQWMTVQKGLSYTPGHEYAVKAMVKIADGANENQFGRVQVYDYTAGQVLGTADTYLQNGWADAYFTFTAPAAGHNVQLTLYEGHYDLDADSHVNFDDIHVWDLTTSTNPLPAYWTRWGATSADSAYYDPNNGDSGAGITVKTKPASGSWQVIETPLKNLLVDDNQNYEPGEKYHYSFSAKQAAGAQTSGRFEIYDYTDSTVLASKSFSGTTWQDYGSSAQTFIAPSDPNNDVRVRLYHNSYTVDATTHFDNIEVQQYADHAVHDGQLAAVLARFVSMVYNHEAPQSYDAHADTMYDYLTDALIPRWSSALVSIDGSHKVYVQPDDGSQSLPNVSLPANQFLPLAEAQAWLYRAGGSSTYQTNANQIFATFKDYYLVNESGAYNWEYHKNILSGDNWRSPYAEDYSHGNLDIRAVTTAAELGMTFTASDMDKFVSTFLDVMWDGSTSDPDITRAVDGTSPYANLYYDANGPGPNGRYINSTFDWIKLGRYDRDIFDHIHTYYDGIYSSVPTHGTRLQQIAGIIKGLNDLRGRYTLDDLRALGGAITTDATSYANDAGLSNFVADPFVTGVAGDALEFDGSNDVVSLGNDPSLTLKDKGTIAFWYKSNGWRSGVYESLISRGYGAGWALSSNEAYTVFSHYGANKIFFSMGDGTGSTDDVGVTRPSDGQWHHYAFTFDGSTVEAYLDGAYQTSVTQTVSAINQDAGLNTYLGNYATPNGVMDQMRIYGRALSGTEITALYNTNG